LKRYRFARDSKKRVDAKCSVDGSALGGGSLERKNSWLIRQHADRGRG